MNNESAFLDNDAVWRAYLTFNISGLRSTNTDLEKERKTYSRKLFYDYLLYGLFFPSVISLEHDREW